jgi:hypothetical protein
MLIRVQKALLFERQILEQFILYFSLEKSGIAGTESEKEKEESEKDKEEKKDSAEKEKDAAKKDEEMEVQYRSSRTVFLNRCAAAH